jgi:hypothetical protein
VSGHPILVTTETEKGRRELNACSVVFVAIGLAGLVMAICCAVAPDTLIPFRGIGDRVLVALICVWGGISSMTAPRSMVRGHWHLDDEQIVFRSLRGVSRRLKWCDVQAISWGRDAIRFRGPGPALPLLLVYEPTDRRKEAREFLRQRLGEAFDLRDRSPQPFSFRRMCVCACVALSIAVLGLTAAFLHSIYLDPRGELRPLLASWVVLPLLAWVAYAAVREARRTWRLRNAPSR